MEDCLTYNWFLFFPFIFFLVFFVLFVTWMCTMIFSISSIYNFMSWIIWSTWTFWVNINGRIDHRSTWIWTALINIAMMMFVTFTNILIMVFHLTITRHLTEYWPRYHCFIDRKIERLNERKEIKLNINI